MRELSKPTAFRAMGAIIGLLLLAAALPLRAGEPPSAAQPAAPETETSLDTAITLANQRVEAEPSSAEARVRLGTLLLEQNSLEAAEKAFDHALTLKPRFHEAMTGKGMVLSRLGQDQAAEEMLQKALRLNPNPVQTHYELGLLYQKNGELDLAISEFKQGLEKFRQGRK